MQIAKTQYKIDNLFLDPQISTFELIVIKFPITMRILAVGSQRINKQPQNVRPD